VDFRAHSEHGARRGFADHLQQAFGGTDGVGFLADLPPAFRMGDHAYAGIFGPHLVDMLGQEALMNGAMSLPHDDSGCAQALRRKAPVQ